MESKILLNNSDCRHPCCLIKKINQFQRSTNNICKLCKMGKNQGDSQNDTMTARLVDSLKCDVSVKESMLKHTSTIIDCEKKKVTVVAKDSKSVLNSLLEDIREVRWLVESWLTFVS